MSRALIRALVLGVVTLVVVLGVDGGPAQAHAVLVSSTPRDGSSVASAPAAVVLRFDESVQLVAGTARVIGDDGTYVDADRAQGSGPTVTIPLRDGVPRGQYTATWRVISADGHVVSGSIHFGVGEPAGTGDVAAPSPPAAVDVAYDIGTGLGTVLLVLVVGLPVGLRILGLGRAGPTGAARLLVGGGTLLAIGAAALALVADQERRQDAGLLSLEGLSVDRWHVTSHTDLMLVLRLACLLGLLGLRTVAATRVARTGRGPAVLAATGLLVSHAWFGHASVGSWVWLAVASTLLHVLAMTVWLGGLLAMVLALLGQVTGPPDEVAAAWGRWSRTATACVGVLLVTGTVQAVRQVRPLASLTDTRYGLLLVAKVAVVGVVLLVAATSRRALATLTGTADVPVLAVRARLLTRVGVELGCLAVVLAITSVLVVQPPARETYGPAATLQAPLGPDRLTVRVASTRRGPQVITVTRESARGRTLPLAQLDGHLSLPTGGLAAIDITFRPTGDGSWRSINAVAPLPGRWELDLDAGINQSTAYATLVRYRVW